MNRVVTLAMTAAVGILASCTGSTEPTEDFAVAFGLDINSIWLVSADGLARKPVITAPGIATYLFYPACSPDGRQIAYSQFLSPTSSSQLFLVNTDGTGSREISGLNGVHGAVAWSPDGQRLAGLPYDGGLAIMNVDGSGLTRIQTTGSPSIYFLPLSWSPDGTELLYTGFWVATPGDPSPTHPGVWAVNIESGTVRQISPNAYYGRWSPDGQRIAYVEGEPLTPGTTLVTVNRDGSSRHVVMPYTSQASIAITWSGDGERIIFSRYSDLYSVDVTGGSPTAFTVRQSSSEIHPHWCGTP